MKLRLFITSLVLAALLPGCSEAPADGPREMPVGMPFDFSAMGKEYELHVLIEKKMYYAVRLYLFLSERNPCSHLLDHHSPEEARKIYALTGSSKDPVTGRWIDKGLSSSLGVRIIRSSDQHQILDHLVTSPSTSAVHMGRYIILANALLPPGIYKAHVTYLDGSPELSPLLGKLAFTIGGSIK